MGNQRSRVLGSMSKRGMVMQKQIVLEPGDLRYLRQRGHIALVRAT